MIIKGKTIANGKYNLHNVIIDENRIFLGKLKYFLPRLLRLHVANLFCEYFPTVTIRKMIRKTDDTTMYAWKQMKIVSIVRCFYCITRESVGLRERVPSFTVSTK